LTAGAKADCALIRAGISAAMDSLLSTVNLRIKIPIRQRATGCGCFVLAVGVETCAHLVCGRHATVTGHGGLAQVEVAIGGQQLVGAVCVGCEAVGLCVQAAHQKYPSTAPSGANSTPTQRATNRVPRGSPIDPTSFPRFKSQPRIPA